MFLQHTPFREDWTKLYYTKWKDERGKESTWGKELWKRVLQSVGEFWRDAIVGLDFAKKMKLFFLLVLFCCIYVVEDTLVNLTYPLS